MQEDRPRVHENETVVRESIVATVLDDVLDPEKQGEIALPVREGLKNFCLAVLWVFYTFIYIYLYPYMHPVF